MTAILPRLNKLIDTDGIYTYIGEAPIGTLRTDAGWRIKCITDNQPDMKIIWGNSSGEFNKVWDNRLSYDYWNAPTVIGNYSVGAYDLGAY
jgi:hypothetical protein